MLKFIPSRWWRSLPSGQELPVSHGQTFHVVDTAPSGVIGHGCAHDATEDVFRHVRWQRQAFEAACGNDPANGDVSIRYPSPLPQGRAEWDQVVLDWHVARDSSRRFTSGPAVLVLDILQGGNLVASYIAKTLAKHGIHGFVMHMPQNGRRNTPGKTHDWSRFLPGMMQAAGDARRGRDVIAGLPLVTGPISLQGTSLGGFVATLAGSIDHSFHAVLLALTGADVYGVLMNGKMDAARVRRHLLSAGYDDRRLREQLWQIEPMRFAHRLNPKRTWLFSARFDQVIPRAHSDKLAAAIGLDWQHHRHLAGCHYTCALGAQRFLSELIRAVPRQAGTVAPAYAVANSFSAPALA